MFGVLTTLIVILGMVFGGGGVTVAAAQSSTPDQALYPVKIWSEDARASLTADPETQVDLALQFASRRAEEIKAMAETGEAVPEAVFLRLQNQIERALQIAADQPEVSGERLLLKTRDRLHQQDQLMQQLTPQTGPEAEACLQQARQMIQERLNWAEDGLADPARLQEHLRLRNGTQNAAPGNAQDDPSRGRENAPGQSEEPGNPWTDESPTPGSGYGLGPGPDANCTPGSAPGMMKTPQPASPGNNPGSGGNGNGGGGKP